MPATATHSHMRIRRQARDISSIPICATAIRCQAFEGEPKLVAIPDDMEAFTETAMEQPERGQQSFPVCALHRHRNRKL